MVVDLLRASRRPLERLLSECRFSEWESIALFLDGGATEAVRWAGGLGYLLSELGISVVVDLQDFAPGKGRAAGVTQTESTKRGIFVVTTFVWDVEGAVLNAAKAYGLAEVNVVCTISEAAHSCHPHAEQILEESGGRVSFADVSEQLKVTLERLLKIEAQSGRDLSGGRPGVVSTVAPSQDVLVSVIHSSLHMGCFFQQRDGTGPGPQNCCAFSLANPSCASTFPLRPCDWGGGGGGGAGAALLAAAAAAASEMSNGQEGQEGRISAEEIPRSERLRYKLLAHVLSEVLWDQLHLDVTGGGGVFTLGDTSRLIGTTLASLAEEAKRSMSDTVGRGGLTGGGGDAVKRREASVVLIDRTLDLTAGASRGGSLLQRVLSSLPRTGTPLLSSTANAEWAPASEAHQQDVGVILPALAPGLGMPAASPLEHQAQDHDANLPNSESRQSPAEPRGRRDESSDAEYGGSRTGRPRLGAMKALAGVAWQAPPSLCHADNDKAAGAVHAMAYLPEEEGQAALVATLERCVFENNCTAPPPKRRGMGASIMALVTSLAKGSPKPGGPDGKQVCFRCRGILQVALAAMEAHQRTSTPAGSRWAETAMAERVQSQELRDGGGSDIVIEQLAASLRALRHNRRAGSTSVQEELLLALRGVSLAGTTFGADEASSFRRAWVERMLAGCAQEPASGVPSSPGERVKELSSQQPSEATGDQQRQQDTEAGLQLELEEIARERTQRLREAASLRAHLSTSVLRDLAQQPYTFVASAKAPTSGNPDAEEAQRDGEEWDDWGDEDEEGGEASTLSSARTTECETLVGRLVGLLLDATQPPVPDLHEAKVMSATSVGLGLLSSGLKKFARIGAGVGGVNLKERRKRARPTDRPVVVIFVVGGYTPLELAEVNGVLQCAASSVLTTGAGGSSGELQTEVLLAGTTISTPDIVYEQVFARPPAEQAS